VREFVVEPCQKFIKGRARRNEQSQGHGDILKPRLNRKRTSSTYYMTRNATHNRSRSTSDTALCEQLGFHTAIVVNFDHGLARKMLADTFEKRLPI
jgi:hypothetical protein